MQIPSIPQLLYLAEKLKKKISTDVLCVQGLVAFLKLPIIQKFAFSLFYFFAKYEVAEIVPEMYTYRKFSAESIDANSFFVCVLVFEISAFSVNPFFWQKNVAVSKNCVFS